MAWLVGLLLLLGVVAGNVAIEEDGFISSFRNLNLWSVYAKPKNMRSKNTVLLLHGARFSSESWVDIGTLEVLARNGYTAIAVDLPGHGKSEAAAVYNYPDWMEWLVKFYNLDKPVLVAPSMSGKYALPYVTKFSEQLSGFIPIAPVSVAFHTVQTYEKMNVPTLIVYGAHDSMGSRSSTILEHIPNSIVFPMRDAGHACYMEDPDTFHEALLEFLDVLPDR